MRRRAAGGAHRGDDPFDLNAVRRTDAALDALAARRPPPSDDPALRLLGALAADVDTGAPPHVPSRRFKRRRMTIRAAVASGVAVAVLSATGAAAAGVGVTPQTFEPIHRIVQVIYPKHDPSDQAADQVRGSLSRAADALHHRRYVEAQRALNDAERQRARVQGGEAEMLARAIDGLETQLAEQATTDYVHAASTPTPRPEPSPTDGATPGGQGTDSGSTGTPSVSPTTNPSGPASEPSETPPSPNQPSTSPTNAAPSEGEGGSEKPNGSGGAEDPEKAGDDTSRAASTKAGDAERPAGEPTPHHQPTPEPSGGGATGSPAPSASPSGHEGAGGDPTVRPSGDGGSTAPGAKGHPPVTHSEGRALAARSSTSGAPSDKDPAQGESGARRHGGGDHNRDHSDLPRGDASTTPQGRGGYPTTASRPDDGSIAGPRASKSAAPPAGDGAERKPGGHAAIVSPSGNDQAGSPTGTDSP